MYFIFVMGILTDGRLDRQQKELLIKICFQYRSVIKSRLWDHCGKDDQEDLLQECFLRLAEHADKLAKLTPPQVTRYVQRVIRSVLIDYRRRKREYVSIDAFEEDMSANGEDGYSPELFCEQRETFARFHDQFKLLPAVDQDVFYLKYVLELPDDLIALQLGISAQSVRTYLSRARKHARELIKLD